MMDKFLVGLGALVSVTLLVAVFSIVLAWPVMLLWNTCLVGAINGINEIGFLQALGISLLCGLLFKPSNSS